MPLLVEHREWPNPALALLLSVYPLASGLAALCSGPISDFVGRRKVLATGLTLFGLSLALHPLFPSLTGLVALRAAAGFAAGMMAGMPAVLLGDLYSGERQRSLIARCVTGYALGQTLGIPIGILLIDRIGFLALNGWIGLGALLLLIPAIRRFAAASPALPRPQIQGYAKLIRSALRSPYPSTLALTAFLGFAAMSICSVTLTLWLYECLSADPTQLAPMHLASGAAQVGVLIVALPMLRQFKSSSLIGTSFAISLAATSWAALGLNSIAACYLLFTLLASMTALRAPSLQQLANQLGPATQKGLRASLIQTSGHLGKAAGAAVATALSISAQPETLLALAALLFAPCAGVFLLAPTRLLAPAPSVP